MVLPLNSELIFSPLHTETLIFCVPLYAVLELLLLESNPRETKI